MEQVKYQSISVVLETWDQARFSDDGFDKNFGMAALNKMFELQPRAKKVFGFDRGQEIGQASAEIHANAFAGLFDSVFQMLGPDVEFMEEILRQVGRRHKTMGVSPSFFPFMGQAVIHTVESYLKRKLTDEERTAWEDVYDAISGNIVKEILS